MKQKITICLLFLLLNQISFGQNKVVDSCDLKTKNSQWKKLFETSESNELKLKLIREKIIFDSIYSEYKPKVNIRCGSTLYAEAIDERGNNCGVKILFAVNYNKKKSIILNLNKNPEYLFIVENLNEINIQKILPVFGSAAEALYGIFGKSGAVILKTENKKFIKKIKRYIKKVKE
ncbi:MAG: hypothetical protein H7250_03565 [Flavobacterium sp.]|nr:hypothetical protein [Flavobacterium sp.]